MHGQESRGGKPNWLDDPTKEAHQHINTLYQLHKQKKLCLGYDYRWIDELVAMRPHVDSAGVSSIAYDDFGTFCQEGYDEWGAIRNAHAYANEHGCEVRSVVGVGPEAAKGKTYHLYCLYYNRATCSVFTNVDWQGATIVIHDEELDWHDRANSSLFTMRPSPVGFTAEDMRPYTNTRTFEKSPVSGSATLTVNNAKLPLPRSTTSINGLSPEVDAAIAELNRLGYQRYYVQLYDSGTLRYARGYGYLRPGTAQWDALIVDASGTVIRQNAAKLAGDETPAGSYIPPDPDPLQ